MKPKVKKRRKPGGGRRTLIEGVKMVPVKISITAAQKAHLKKKGKKGNVSDGARKIITHDMAMDQGDSDET